MEISRRSRGTPRIANSLLRRVRDFAQVKGNGTITYEIAQMALKALNIDQYGLDEIDNKILTTIIDKFRGGPVGVSTIATAIGEDGGTVEEVYEPFLIMEGFIKRTPRGRMATKLAYEHLGRNPYGSNISGESFSGQQQAASQQQQSQRTVNHEPLAGEEDDTLPVPVSLQGRVTGNSGVDIFA